MTVPLLTKDERSARMWEEHPLKLSHAEQLSLGAAVRAVERKERKL